MYCSGWVYFVNLDNLEHLIYVIDNFELHQCIHHIVVNASFMEISVTNKFQSVAEFKIANDRVF